MIHSDNSVLEDPHGCVVTPHDIPSVSVQCGDSNPTGVRGVISLPFLR